MPSTDVLLEQYARELEASGRYRILRDLSMASFGEAPDGVFVKKAVFVDVETTGLDVWKDEVIELAMVQFNFDVSGNIYDVGKPYQAFREPKRPISQTITRLTGITEEMVSGCLIDAAELDSFTADAELIVAHNAGFDRPFVERLSPSFATKPWACSMSQVDWANEGYEGTRLSYLVAGAGFFYDRHRAVNDCLAAIRLLATPLPISGRPAMVSLLMNAQRRSWRIWAERAPFEFKDILKARGYKWNGDGSASPRAWYVDVDEDDLNSELLFLRNEVYRREVNLPLSKYDAFNRFSGRA